MTHPTDTPAAVSGPVRCSVGRITAGLRTSAAEAQLDQTGHHDLGDDELEVFREGKKESLADQHFALAKEGSLVRWPHEVTCLGSDRGPVLPGRPEVPRVGLAAAKLRRT